MMLRRLRRTAAPIALATYASFFLAMTPWRLVQAKEPDDDPNRDSEPSSAPPAKSSDRQAPAPRAIQVEEALRNAEERIEVGGATATISTGAADSASGLNNAKEAITSGSKAMTLAPTAGASGTSSAASPAIVGLPTGADKTGVSSQAISVPSGAGKIQGMGESF